MNPIERKLLTAACTARNRWRAEQFRASFGGNREGARHNRRILDARDGVVDLDLTAWLGNEPTPAERRAASRALEALQVAGFVVRIGHARTTHVRITEAGELALTTKELS